MRTILILLAILLIVSLGLNAWTLSQLTAVKKELKDQGKKVSKMIEDVNKLEEDSQHRKSQPSTSKEVLVAFDDDPIKGDPKAPVTIVEFSDYQCPFCRKFHKEVLPKIQEEYISKGKVRYIFRDFPLRFHQKAVPAAIAANCAGEQDKYWEMNDFLFDNPSKLEIEAVLTSVNDLGLDYGKFEECVKNDVHKAEINKDYEDGRNYGVRGTPSLFIGKTGVGPDMKGFYIRGTRPFESIKPQIDKLLQEN